MILAPMEAWIATSNICRGMSCRIFETRSFAAFVGEIAMHDDGERIDRLAGDQDVELDHGRLPVVGQVIIEGSVAAGDGFQAIVKIEHDFVQR